MEGWLGRQVKCPALVHTRLGDMARSPPLTWEGLRVHSRLQRQSVPLSSAARCEQRQVARATGKMVCGHHPDTGLVGGQRASLTQQP